MARRYARLREVSPVGPGGRLVVASAGLRHRRRTPASVFASRRWGSLRSVPRGAQAVAGGAGARGCVQRGQSAGVQRGEGAGVQRAGVPAVAGVPGGAGRLVAGRAGGGAGGGVVLAGLAAGAAARVAAGLCGRVGAGDAAAPGWDR